MSKEHSDLVKDHFEMKYYDYDVLIRKLIPRYDEMHDLVVKSIRLDPDEKINILDLGVGTGQTASSLLEKYTKANLHGVDISPKMISLAEKRLGAVLDRVTFSEQDIKDLVCTERYCACVAVLSVHHLNEQDKPQLFKKIYDSLEERGLFVIGDIVKFDSEEETKEKEQEWKEFLIKSLGSEEGDYWFRNYQEEDLPSSVSYQLRWLRGCGFSEVKTLWEYMNYAVIFARK